MDAVQDLSATGQNVFSFELAVDATGNAVAAWTHGGGGGDRVHSSFNPVPPGALPTPGPWRLPGFDLSPAGSNASSPQLAIDAASNAFFSWTSSDGSNLIVRLRRRAANGTLGLTQDLSGPGQNAGQPALDVDPAGNSLVAWVRFDGLNNIVQARRRAAEGTLGAVLDLSAAGQNASEPDVAVDPAGNAHFVWWRSNGTNTIVQTRMLAADGTLGGVQDLSGTGNNAESPHVAVDPAGNAHFVWRRFDGGSQIVQSRLLSADGTLGPVQDLSAAGLSALDPQVAVDPAGNAHFAWRRSDGTNFIIQSRARPASGALGLVQDLSATGQDASPPQLAVDPAGNAYFTWNRSDGANPIAQARRRAVDGTFGAVEQLAVNAIETRVAMDFAGNAYFAWQRFDGADNRVEARLRTAAGALGTTQGLSPRARRATSPRSPSTRRDVRWPAGAATTGPTTSRRPP